MGTVSIAQISDLHFGAESQEHTWATLKDHLIKQINNHKIHLVLVTGDIVDSPKDRLLKRAKEELDDLGEYLVCPGNHDRHWRGNTTRVVKPVNWIINHLGGDGLTKFSEYFKGKMPTVEDPIYRKIQDEQDEWNLLLFGVDSSIHADLFARGFLTPKDVDGLEPATKNEKSTDVDLSILLCHHHLLPVRDHERNIEPKHLTWADIWRTTNLVNAGTSLEKLTKAHIDLVLHGHEHAANWGKYGTIEAHIGETIIIGAGSATGAGSVTDTVTLAECNPNRMSYNLIRLYPDRSAGLFVMEYASGNFREKYEEFTLMNAETMRRHRALRQFKAEDTVQLAEEVVKIVEFTSRGDGIVNQYRTDWIWKDDAQEWSLQARNATGTPTDLKVRFFAADERFDLHPDPIFKRKGVEYTWEARQRLTDSFFARHKGQPLRVEESYRWDRGTVLTLDQMNLLRTTTDAGPLRSDGKEFVVISIKDWFKSAFLLVRIPPEFAPDPKTVEVWVFQETNPLQPERARKDISAGLRHLGQGLFSLTVPYPRKGFRYCLSWEPPPVVNDPDAPLENTRARV